MRFLHRYSLYIAFCAIFGGGMAGCEPFDSIIANIVAGFLDGSCNAGNCGACDSCDSCSSCDACNCGDSCGACLTISAIPGGYLKQPGHGVVPNAATVRLSSSGVAFIGTQIPTLASALVSTVPIDISNSCPGLFSVGIESVHGQAYVELEGPTPGAPFVFETATGVNDAFYASGAHAALRVRGGAYAKTCAPIGARVNTSGHDVSSGGRVVGTCDGDEPSSDIQIRWGSTFICGPCGFSLDTRRSGSANIPFTANVGLVRQASSSLSRLAVLDVSVPEDSSGKAIGIEGGDFYNNCGGGLTDIQNIVDDMRSRINGIIRHQVETKVLPQLCMHPTSATDPTAAPTATNNTCPTGSKLCSRDGAFLCGIGSSNCASDPVPCVPMPLGLEGRIDIGSALAAVSPGVLATIDFFGGVGDLDTTAAVVGAAIDAGTATNGGFNIDLLAGLEAVPHNDCVPVLPPPMPYVRDLAPSLRGNDTPGAGGAAPRPYHVGVGTTAGFANYALWKVWDSGALCLNVGTNLSPMLSPSLLATAGLLFQDPNKFLFPLDSATTAAQTFMSLSLRPQAPPTIATTTIPNPDTTNFPGATALEVNVAMNDLEIDFSFFTQDRYVRAATLHTNVTIKLVASTQNGLAVINLAEVHLPGAHWVNSPLLSDSDFAKSGDHYAVQDTIEGIVPLALSMAGAGALPIKLDVEGMINPAIKGLLCGTATTGTKPGIALDLPNDALQTFNDNGQEGGGAFVNLVTATYDCAQPLTGEVDTTLRVTNVSIPGEHHAFAPTTFGEGERPRIEIAMAATGPSGVTYEYSYRTSITPWSDWSESPYAVLEHTGLLVQGDHTVLARARVKGAPESLDPTPARVDVTIDVTAPFLQVAANGQGEVELQAVDFVDPPADLEYRVRAPGEDFSEWRALERPVVALGRIDAASEVEVRDSSGNIGSNIAPLVGQAAPSITRTTSGCGCSTAGRTNTGGNALAIFASLLVAGLVVARRRRRA